MDITAWVIQGIPDVSAQGDNFVIYVNGAARSVGGTSAATPTFASIVSLLNDARIASGKPPLGFLNPLVYFEGGQCFQRYHRWK